MRALPGLARIDQMDMHGPVWRPIGMKGGDALKHAEPPRSGTNDGDVIR
jgi:hypothetical protein